MKRKERDGGVVIEKLKSFDTIKKKFPRLTSVYINPILDRARV